MFLIVGTREGNFVSKNSPKDVKCFTNYFLLSAAIGKCLHQLLVVQAFRPDRLLAMASKFVAAVMGDTFAHVAEKELNLADIVNTEVGVV